MIVRMTAPDPPCPSAALTIGCTHPIGILTQRQVLIKFKDTRLFLSVIMNIAMIKAVHISIQNTEINAERAFP